MEKHKQEPSADWFERVERDEEKAQEISRPSRTFFQDAVRVLFKNVPAMIALISLILIILMGFFGSSFSSYGPNEQALERSNLTPKIPVLENISWLNVNGMESSVYEHVTAEQAQANAEVRFGDDSEFVTYTVLSEGDGSPSSGQVRADYDRYAAAGMEDEYFYFGTDRLGRDLWTRAWEGTKVSLYIAFLAAAIDLVVGVAYGGISGYYGGRVDNYMMRFLEILMGIPNLVVVILMIIILEPGIISIAIALAITGWTGMARVIRGEVLKLKGQEYVMAAKTIGVPDRKIIAKHLIPNVMGLIIINTMFTIPSAIFFEAFLSFIGLGLQAPEASLGTLVNDGFKALTTTPHVLVFPAVIISIIMISFNVLADGLRDSFDPKMRDR
ncbi:MULTISPECIES: oligopeptide ABC transporter permease [Sinobaca]|uniref:Oligopeptide transport system permease protein n=1 Tax=Sinobaca qinghaiensis TaxID=342944 RepID=A0A419UUB4_9BACL|nr:MULTISPECIES: oligopeptide ABC transporter permease [Sinobaca]RKD68068.1 oligopeptide transport system permease protein [Sinobaca qinghaiensis]